MKRASTVFSVLAIFCVAGPSILARSASADPLPDAVSYEYFGFNFADSSNTVGTLDYTGEPGCGSICTATTQLGADPSVSATFSEVTYDFTSGGGVRASLGYYVEYLNTPGTYTVDLHSLDSLSVTDGQTQASAALTFGPAGSNTTSLNNFSSVTLQEAACVNGCPNPGFYPPPSQFVPDQQVQMKANTLYFVQSDLLFAAQPTHVQISGMIDPTFSTSSGGQFIYSPGVLSPVPEPATWALMIIGLMVIGAVALRRTTATVNRRHGCSLLVIVAGFIGCGTAYAQDYTYNVDYNIGSDIITGQFVLNCDSCTLSKDNFVSWSFSDTDGDQVSSSDPSTDSSVLMAGSGSNAGYSSFSATPTSVTFTPSTNPSYFDFFHNYCSSNQCQNGGFYFETGIASNSGIYSYLQVDNAAPMFVFSPVTIATAAVPEPSTVWLALVGVVLLVLTQWRRLLRGDSTAELGAA